jgi:hypothetical protein
MNTGGSCSNISPMQQLFGTAAINPAAWGRIIMISVSVLFVVELEKYLLRKCALSKKGFLALCWSVDNH